MEHSATIHRLLLFLSLTSAGLCVAPPSQGGLAGAAPEYPSPFTDYLLKTVVAGEVAAESAPGATDLEISYLRGEVDGTDYTANIVGENPGWMTDFGTKTDLEQVLLEPMEMQIVLFAQFGDDPSSDAYHYWQGYEDAIQGTLDSMNSWAGTGGEVLGTTVEYTLFIPGQTETDPPAPAPSVATTPAISTPIITKAPTILMPMPLLNPGTGPRPIPIRRAIMGSMTR
jgi:hypothetical protein